MPEELVKSSGLSSLLILFMLICCPLWFIFIFSLQLCSIDNKSKQVVAIKVIDLEEAEDEIEDIQQEIHILAECDSPHVTRYYGSYLKVSVCVSCVCISSDVYVCLSLQGTKLWIIMEYLGGGSALDLVSHMTFYYLCCT